MSARHKLSAAFVRSAPVGKYEDGAGLRLVKREDGGGQWVLRITVHGRRREMGLGSLADVSLAEARRQAERWRTAVGQGLDPIKERAKEKRLAARGSNDLATVAADAFEARKAELKADGKAGRWFSPLELHVLPKLGKVPVEEIDARDIRDTLAPIWHTKAATAKKAIDRLTVVLRHGAALGLEVDLQATAKAKALLGQSRHQPTHIAAMPWQDVPAFYASLAEPTVTHLAFRLLILTGLRSGPVRFLHVDQLDDDIWTIPGEGMKGRRGKTPDFRVPLVGEARRIIDLALPFARDGFLFPSVRQGVISDMTMTALMNRRGLKARPHGFRTSLRTWLAETTDTRHEVAEMMIAHSVDSSVVRTYRRTDFLEDRRILLERWAQHVTGAVELKREELDL